MAVHPARRGARAAIACAFAAVALVVVSACQPTPPIPGVPLPGAPTGPPPGVQPKRVAVYGDSLLASSELRWRFTLRAGLPKWDVLERVRWGAAPCDARDQMVEDAALNWNIQVVVIEFYGNAITSCAQGQDVATMYHDDLDAAVRLWQAKGVRVVLVAGPGRVGTEPESIAAAAARLVATERKVRLVEAGEPFVDPKSGRYERVIDGVEVRAPDGIHLCDHAKLNSLICPVDAPGVVQFVDPIVDAAVAEGRLVK